ncbi:TetR-like C-terminal domain-containing protein [Amycolatopsis sp. cmx-8-4]|uniref:TetR-like C-terminal domain-containing protein n=1 Tax=Amycolatopsis sp. cmx-8-4 TaxID=2790947 RepID=UPI003979E565
MLAARAWAVREPSRFALLYGTPVLGCQAPGEQAAGPGTRVVAAPGRLAEDAWRTGKLRKVDAALSRPVRKEAFLRDHVAGLADTIGL